MMPVHTVSEVLDAIQQVKAGSPDFCTNFFPVQKKIQDWIGHEELIAEIRHDAILFFRRDRDFWHLYYCASSKTALYREMATVVELRTEPVVVDIVGKESDASANLKDWASAGFHRYTRLFRMARAVGSGSEQSVGTGLAIEFAGASDSREVFDLLERGFDRYGEQLPLSYEMDAAIQARQVLIARHDQRIAGLLFFETQGFSSTLRFWTVAAEHRALKVGSALMRQYFATQSVVKRFVLWVAADNMNAVQKYGHYGYKPDGLVDYVLVNQMVRS